MLIVVANDLPPSVRGRMKLWFVEPRANVFVSGLKDSVARHVVEYLHDSCPVSSGVTIFRSTNKPPGYEISSIGKTRKELVEISGLRLTIETLRSEKTQDKV